MRIIPDTINDLGTLIDYFRLVLAPEDFALLIGILERHFDELTGP